MLEPSRKAIQEALADALMLPELPRRIECFDISHIQGAETVASLVVWEDGKMNKSAYRKFKVKTVAGVDDFASMREVVERRYRRIRDGAGDQSVHSRPAPLSHQKARRKRTKCQGTTSVVPKRRQRRWGFSPRRKIAASKEPTTMPSLILIDGGLGQLHAAAEALESLGFTSQPLAAIAKKEEVIYLYGNEDEPIVLDRRSPVLHLVQLIRDESHRFAVGYHRQRRAMRDRDSELLQYSRRRPANPPAPAHPLRQPARRATSHARFPRRRRHPQNRRNHLAALPCRASGAIRHSTGRRRIA